MKKLVLQNKIWAIFFALAFVSSLFLFSEYKSNSELALTSNFKNTLIEKETTIDEDELESRDFYIFKNITELINDIFSLSL